MGFFQSRFTDLFATLNFSFYLNIISCIRTFSSCFEKHAFVVLLLFLLEKNCGCNK